MNTFVNAPTINQFKQLNGIVQHPGVARGEALGDQLIALGKVARSLAAKWKAAAAQRAARRADAQFLAYAQFDPRIMADLNAAVLRHEAGTGVSAGNLSYANVHKVLPSLSENAFETARRMRMAVYY